MKRSLSTMATATAAVALLCLLLVPAAGAQSTEFTWVDVTLTPQRFDADLYGEQIENDTALMLREEIDTDHGNGDGDVSASERDAWIEAAVQDLNDRLSNPFVQGLTKKITVNERPPLESVVTGMELSANVLGATTDDSTVVRDVYAQLRFTETTRDHVNVSFAQDFRQALIGMEWGYTEFHGNETWKVDPETIAPGGVDNPYWTGDGFNVTYAEMDSFSSGFEPLTFQLFDTTQVPDEPKKKDKDSPGVGLPLVLVGIVAIAAVLHRRR